MPRKLQAAKGAPAWMSTFADLMALMMTFFVLLFSFSHIDEVKYRMMVQSFAQGFGNNRVTARNAPSPTIASPSSINSPFSQMQAPSPSSRSRNRIQTSEQASATAARIKIVLQAEVEQGRIALETQGNSVLIRLPEEVAFPPGSDRVSAEMQDIMRRLAPALRDSTGAIMVTGHTDDRPISSSEFASNWELSADRAVAVVHELVQFTGIAESRFAAVGHGSTRPIAPNDTPENRARNRRVDISIVEGLE